MLLPLLALALLAQPAVAPAAIGQTNVTSPPDPTYRTVGDTTPEVAVEGEAPGAADGDLLDLWCVYGTSGDTIIRQDVAVASEEFETTAIGNAFSEGTCRLIAVPDGTNVATADLSPYDGPLVTSDSRREYRTAADAEGSPDLIKDYLFSHQQARGLFAFYALNSCGICSARLFYADTARSSEYVFWFNGFLKLSEGAPFNRSAARVDGHNAWGSLVADLSIGGGDTGEDLEGVPPLVYSSTGGGVNEDLVVDEAQNLVRCENGDPWPVTRAGCGKFVPTGVRVERRTRTTRDGTLLTFTDVFRSADGAQHVLDLRWTEGFKQSNLSFQFPWKDSSYTTYSGGSSIPATGPGSAIFFRTNNDAPDGDRLWAQGALVYDAAIGPIDFIDKREFRFPTSLTVPAGDSVTLRHAYAMAPTRAELVEVMTPIEDQYVPPTVAITSPRDDERITEREITVRGTAADNKGVASVTVNGRAATLAADGTWTARVLLELGDNTVTATARDAAANEASATRQVRLDAPHNVCCAPPPLRDVVAPVLEALAMTNRTFAVARGATAVSAAAKRGTVVRYALSEPATVAFAIARRTKGRRVGRRCRPATARNRRGRPCTRYVRAGRTILRRSGAGRASLRFTGRIGRRALRPGRHRMAIVASDLAGNRSRPRRLAFRIVRR